ncbi:phage anti-repressor protein/phage antirepressor YoqD-like protein [Bartonella chomelii]|uniref:Phage anti-repressor protein/phage antirepressor YoqD-like protein n=1 Tax=Bartonella chomelii TaxID=236402 RepID=A0ABR6E4P3_9HYPH|nr:antA/AntB antirepressor family protein [Bartonella chomelii]MBA9083294.1 phage anti-repressor protein/phage antirepressor YoqD-like protein [Bartonella chomelii]
MEALIAIHNNTINQEPVQTVNARELHAFLEIGKDFSTWIKDRIGQYEFEEGKDFIKTQDLRSPKLGNAKSRVVLAINYHLTLDMAKELAMVERNERGKQARQYFIECERKAKQVTTSQIDYSNPQVMLGVFTHLKNENERKDYIIAKLTPKAEALERLERSDGLFGISEAAKILGLLPKDLTSRLLNNYWAYRSGMDKRLLPYQSKINEGLMDCVSRTIQIAGGREMSVSNAKITPKGLTRLSVELQKQTLH